MKITIGTSYCKLFALNIFHINKALCPFVTVISMLMGKHI